jgi:hypothetical protein
VAEGSSRKTRARELLHREDREALLSWAAAEPSARRTLFSLLCDTDPAVCRRSAEAIGWLSAVQAESDLEPVREQIRRLVWSMNDEAGSLIRHAPTAIGAILYHVPELIDEYAHVLASFGGTEPFQESVRQALDRLSEGEV